MKFEHLVEINDPNDPQVAPLGRAQLWRGLVLRVENPLGFIYGLDECTLGERGVDFVDRTLRFGGRHIRDRVRFLPQETTDYHIPAGPDYPASHLQIRIEEPAPGRLYLRFLYEIADGSGPQDETTAELRKQAYFAADLDTVSRIRELAKQGQLR